jgi:membrane associated rhomboid family serine protease
MGPHEASAPEALHCYRHPDRETLLSCSNCDRPICERCMTAAAVGLRCPECAGRSGRARGSSPMSRPLGAAATGTPIATIALVAINVLVFLLEMAQGVTLWGAGSSEAADAGAVYGPGVADGEWWRMVTGGFFHAGLVHLGFNMYLLWMIGGALERYAGTLRFLAIYFSALLWGSAAALLFSPDSHTIGASGAVFGLMAALFLLERQKGVALLGGSVGALLAINLVFTFAVPGVSIGAHVGGILGGAAAGFVLSGYGKGHMAYGRLGVQGWGAIAALIVGAVAVGVVAS